MAFKKPLGRGLNTMIHGSMQKGFNNQEPKKSVPAEEELENSEISENSESSENSEIAEKSVPADKKTVPAKSVPAAGTPKIVATINSNILPYREIALSKISLSPSQSRKNFDSEKLAELADSIRAEGLLQPIIVRKNPKNPDNFELIAGERRFRAFGLLNLPAIPCRVVEASDASSAAMCLIENLQRENLNPMEEAIGLGSLMRDFNLTQEAVSERVGKARSTVANSLRLLSLDKTIQGYIASGQLTAGHAKALLAVTDTTDRLLLATKLVEEQSSVRVAEQLAAKVNAGKSLVKKPSSRAKAPEISSLERDLTSKFQTRVQVLNGKKKGRIVLFYNGNEDLERLLEAIGYKN